MASYGVVSYHTVSTLSTPWLTPWRLRSCSRWTWSTAATTWDKDKDRDKVQQVDVVHCGHHLG